jgi:hypothetical protein
VKKLLNRAEEAYSSDDNVQNGMIPRESIFVIDDITRK